MKCDTYIRSSYDLKWVVYAGNFFKKSCAGVTAGLRNLYTSATPIRTQARWWFRSIGFGWSQFLTVQLQTVDDCQLLCEHSPYFRFGAYFSILFAELRGADPANRMRNAAVFAQASSQALQAGEEALFETFLSKPLSKPLRRYSKSVLQMC